MTIGSLIIGLVGLAVGAAAVWLAVRDRLRASAEAGARALALEQEMRGLERRAIEAEAQLDAERGTLDARVTNAVKAASAAAYAESNAQLVELAKGRFETTVAPLNESLKLINRRVEEADRARAQSYGAVDAAAHRSQRPHLDPGNGACGRLTCAGAGGRCS